MRPRAEVKDWADLIWFKGNIHKHAFTMWVANYNRLPTRIRLAAWGMNVPRECCLCASEEETRDHLLLTYDFSKEVWRLVLSVLNPDFQGFRQWSELLSWIQLDSAIAPTVLRKLATQATVFQIWKQQNNILHNAVLLPPFIVFKAVEREVRNSISARRQSNWLR